MIQIILLVLALGIGLPLVARWFANTRPRQVLSNARWVAVALLLLVGLFLAATGRLAGLFAVLGALLLWVQRLSPVLVRVMPWALRRRQAGPTASGPAPGGGSRLKTRSLDMQLDRTSGVMDGYVLRPGALQGRSLASLPLPALLRLLAECRRDDADSARVLETYLDHRFGADWVKQDASPRSGGRMSQMEAYALLGLADGATPDAVRSAHRKLMKRHHPDHGGTAEIAAKLNAARDLLLGV